MELTGQVDHVKSDLTDYLWCCCCYDSFFALTTTIETSTKNTIYERNVDINK